MFSGVLEIIRRWIEGLLTGPELIVNGSFEEQNGHLFNGSEGIQQLDPKDNDPKSATSKSAISGWLVDPASDGRVVWFRSDNKSGINKSGIKPANGRLFVDLCGQGFYWTGLDGGIISGGVLSAEFPTQAGRRYLLKARIGTYEVKDSTTSGPVAIRVVAGGKFAGRLDNRDGDPGALTRWVSGSLVFMATGPRTAVEIRGWVPEDLYKERTAKSIATPTFLGLDYVSVRELWRFPFPWQWLLVR